MRSNSQDRIDGMWASAYAWPAEETLASTRSKCFCARVFVDLHAIAIFHLVHIQHNQTKKQHDNRNVFHISFVKLFILVCDGDCGSGDIRRLYDL